MSCPDPKRILWYDPKHKFERITWLFEDLNFKLIPGKSWEIIKKFKKQTFDFL